MLLEQMLKRQDSLLSSSRRETPPPPPSSSQRHHAATTSVGCMSGIFHLITKYQNRNKRLTSGRKHNKSSNSSKSSSHSSPKRANKVSRTTQSSPSGKEYDGKKISSSSCNNNNVVVPRSPTLRNQPSLMARLMGLEEVPGRNNISPCSEVVRKEESSDEGKRRKLLQALERCNDDLATLKKVIKAVQVVEKHVVTPETVEVVGGSYDDHQRLSRAAVIHHRFRSPMPTTNGVEASSPPCKAAMMRKKPRQEDNIETYLFRKSSAKTWDIKRELSSTLSKSWSNKAMIQSVDQVCKDIAWGEKREAGKIGLMLQECLWKDLIEEIVQEMIGCWIYVLPFEACKRRLFS